MHIHTHIQIDIHLQFTYTFTYTFTHIHQETCLPTKKKKEHPRTKKPPRTSRRINIFLFYRLESIISSYHHIIMCSSVNSPPKKNGESWFYTTPKMELASTYLDEAPTGLVSTPLKKMKISWDDDSKILVKRFQTTSIGTLFHCNLRLGSYPINHPIFKILGIYQSWTPP